MPPPQAPTSFIPKKPLDTGSATYTEHGGTGFFFVIALFVFILSLVAAGGVFGYKQILTKSIADKQASLQKYKDAFSPSDIKAIVKLNDRINNSKTLLNTHVAPSAIFAFLGQQTLLNVQFTSFDYVLNVDHTASITLSGAADNFTTVASQSDRFGSTNGVLKDVVFSDIQTNSTGISFHVSATVDASYLNYAKNLGNPATQQSAPVDSQATTTTP
jgi:hypothetical protein